MKENNLLFFLVPHHNAPEIRLKKSKTYFIGRSPQNDILLTDSIVSRKHAKMHFQDTSFIIEDLGSTNGTMVNGQEITRQELTDGNIVIFGKVFYTFRIKEKVKDEESTHSPEDTLLLEEQLDKIIKDVQDLVLKKQLLSFKKNFIEKKKNLIDLAYIDDLTGLFNRRYFDKILYNEIKRANRYERPLTLILVDIDHFKLFNDKFGHQKGDSVLRTVGGILRENSRTTDIVCRYGGEEIAILLPEQNLTQGFKIAEKLRKVLAVEAKEIEEVSITASFGVSCTTGETITGDKLIKKSDEALYLAKKSGRNCVKALGLHDEVQ